MPELHNNIWQSFCHHMAEHNGYVCLLDYLAALLYLRLSAPHDVVGEGLLCTSLFFVHLPEAWCAA
jgi:hypothetical protein